MSRVFGIVGRGWVSNHRARAVVVGSTPAFFHHAASSPQRWASRWWPRHSGTMNSSLTLRPSARLREAKGWASDGLHYTATLSLSPSARITFRMVANSGFPSVESAL